MPGQLVAISSNGTASPLADPMPPQANDRAKSIVDAAVIVDESKIDTVTPSDKMEAKTDDEEDENSSNEEEEEEEQEGFEELLDEIQPTAQDKNEGYCVLDNRLACHTEETFIGQTLKVPCARNTRPQPLEGKAELELLKEVCPEFLEDLPEGESPKLCCNYQGLRDLQENYRFPKQFGLTFCPSCYYNFRRIFCNSACSPRQNKFLRIDRTTPVEVHLANQTHSLRKVDQMTYFMNENFANGLYESCLSKSFLL